MANESSTSHELIQAEEKGRHPKSSHDRGLLLIGLFKLAKAIFFFGVGVGAIHLLHKDLEDEIMRLAGSMSQPKCAPLSRYSCIFACTVLRRSDGERISTTKSGQSGRNFCFCSGVKAAKRERSTQAASGARMAPLGRIKPQMSRR